MGNAATEAEPAAPAPPAPVGSAAPERGRRWLTAGDLAVLAQRLLSVEALCRVGALAGRVRYWLRRREARALRANLAPLAATRRDASRLAREFMEDRAARRLFPILAPRMTPAEVRRVVALRDLHHLEAAVAPGSGAILLMSHLHSMAGFLAVMQLRTLGFDVQVALPTMADPWSASRARALLERWIGPAPTVPDLIGGFACQFNIRPIVQRLQRGRVVAQTVDGWHAASFVDVPFLGRSVPFPTGVLSVARLTGVPVVPLYLTGRPPRLTGIFEASFAVGRAPGELDAAVRQSARRLEHYIRSNPAGWEHWQVPSTLERLASWRDLPLRSKYAL